MREFFIDEMPSNFKMFNTLHISMILFVVLGFLVIYINKGKISNISLKNQRIIEITFASILFLNMLIYYLSYIIYRAYDWKVHLPLHFCFIAGFMFMYLLIFKNKKIFKLVFFFSFAGPIPAIIWSDIRSGFDAYVFYQLFISHHLFILFSLFIFYMYDLKFKFKDLINAFILGNALFIDMSIFNYIFKTNYIMSNKFPDTLYEMYPFLKHVDHPFILLEPMFIITISFAYLFVYLRNKEKPLQ